MPQSTAGRHRRGRSRHRSSPVSATALLGTALGASLVAGVAIGTAAAAAGGPGPAHMARVSEHGPAQPPTASGTNRAGTAAAGENAPIHAAAAGTAPAPADENGPIHAAAAGGTAPAPAGENGPIQAAAASGNGRVPSAGLVENGVPTAVAFRQKPRAVVKLAVRAAPAWVDPNPTAAVTSCFGQRWGRLHAGVDLAAPDGTPIVAAGAGIVVRAGVAEGYGNAVLIDHGNGYLTHYGHLSKITVTVGQHVGTGQQIGNEGSTGHSTGPHLHFEVHQGYYQNPIEPTAWMHRQGVDIPGCVPLT